MSTMSTAYGGSAQKKPAFDTQEKKALLAAEKLAMDEEIAGGGWDDWGDDLDGLDDIDNGPASSSPTPTPAARTDDTEDLLGLLG
jgi:hypothetical protein